MRKLTALALALALIIAPAAVAQEESKISADGVASVYNAFSLTLPDEWREYELSPERAEGGGIALYGGGERFMLISASDGEYADMEAYAQHLATTEGRTGAFLSDFNGSEFVLYNDYAAASSVCSIILPGKGIFGFTFFPTDGNEDFATTILEIMNTFSIMEEAGDAQ